MFWLNAGVEVNTRERKKLERIYWTISRPTLSAGTIGAAKLGYGQLCLENSVSGWEYWAAIRLGGILHVVFNLAAQAGARPGLEKKACL